MLGAGITVGAMAISGMGFVLIFGYAHQIALGHTAFSMIGAYGSAILTARHGWDPLVAMLFSMGLAILLAGVVGFGCCSGGAVHLWRVIQRQFLYAGTSESV